MNYDVFNGDADGLCSIRQLRLAKPLSATPVTGMKRDINLMERIQPNKDDVITAADISLDRNRQGVSTALQAGASVSWFDHHFSGESITHPNFEAHIRNSADICSSLIVYEYLRKQGQQLSPAWALTGAFGDGLDKAALLFAKGLSADEQFSHKQLGSLKELGVLMNYNSYGEKLEDLHVQPQNLYTIIQQYESPLGFIVGEAFLADLRQGYQEDFEQALNTEPHAVNDVAAIYILPDTTWSRRVSGTWGNHLLQKYPNRGHAIMFPLSYGGWRVSVRAPLNYQSGADALCRQFPTGGGRNGAAGIDRLSSDLFEEFKRNFMSYDWKA